MEDFPKRKQHRLHGYDYSKNGYYFVTICTHERKCVLATVGNAVPGVPQKMIPTAIGEIVLRSWAKMSEIDKNIETDWFCLMPNHIHGIIIIKTNLRQMMRRNVEDDVPYICWFAVSNPR